MVAQEAISKQTSLYQFFHEMPDKRMASVSMIMLIVSSLVTLVLPFMTGSWFTLLVPITGFLIAAGYAFRIMMMNNPKVSYFVTMQILLVVPPLLFAATNYTCLGKVMGLANGDTGSFLTFWLGKIFLLADVLCLGIQLFGASYLTSSDHTKVQRGSNIMMVGTLLALAVNILFIGVLAYVSTHKTFSFRKRNDNGGLWAGLYITMALLLVRNVYRTIEFIQQKQAKDGVGYLASHEVYMYLFDFAIIFVCLILFSVFHYGFYV